MLEEAGTCRIGCWSCGAVRKAALAAAGITAVLAVILATGCSCAKKADKALQLGKTITVGGFPVRVERLEVFGEEAVLTWSAPVSLAVSKTKRRNFEFGTGPESQLVGIDDLRYPARGPSKSEEKEGRVRGTLSFDAAGLDLAKLARIEVDGARWVDDVTAEVTVESGKRTNFSIGKARFEVVEVVPSGTDVQIRIAMRPGEDGAVGTIIGVTVRPPGGTPTPPTANSDDGEHQTLTFRASAAKPLPLGISAIRTQEAGPFALTIKKSRQPSKESAPKKTKKG